MNMGLGFKIMLYTLVVMLDIEYNMHILEQTMFKGFPLSSCFHFNPDIRYSQNDVGKRLHSAYNKRQ